MAGISFSGLATGLDSDAIVNSLVDIQRIPQLRLEQENQFNQSKISIIDDLSSALSSLQTTANDLDTIGEFLSFSGSSSDESVATVTASGDSVAGHYQLEVTQLAQAQRTYSNVFSDRTSAISDTAQTLEIQVGDTTTTIDIDAGASLENIVGEINGSGADVTAGILFDGTNYRLQIVGNSTGADNAVTFTDSGLGLGLSEAGNTVQAAVDAEFTLDGFAVTSSDNLIDDVIPGTTFELKDTTQNATTVSVAADSDAVQEKVQAFVDAYNRVFTIINAQVGEGKGQDTLNGDATVRSIEQGLSKLVSSAIPGLTTAEGDTLQLADLGIKTSTDGKLTLDTEKLTEKLASGFQSTARYFAGDSASNTDGFSQLLDDLIESYTDSTDGLLAARKDGLESQIDNNTDRIDEMERFIASYEQSLRDQFTALESAMSSLQTQQAYLAQFVQTL